MFSLAGSPSSSGGPSPQTPRWGRPTIGSPGLPGGTMPASGSTGGEPFSSDAPREGRATVFRLPQMLSYNSSAAGTPLRSADGTQPPSYGGTAPNSNATILGPGGTAAIAENGTGNSNATTGPPPESNHVKPPHVASRGGCLEHVMSVAMLALLPWLQFVVIMLAFTFQGGHRTMMAWALLLLTLAFASLAQTLDKSNKRGPMYMYIAVLGVVAVASGFLCGNFVYGMYTSQWWGLRIRAAYANVPPTDSALSRDDGGVISFTSETMLDLNRVIGYTEMRHTYCVAPIFDDTQQTQANFWAVGRDCCEHRWNFNCGDARDPRAKAGIVYQESPEFFATHWRAQYDAAARQAASVYGISIPERPVFVTWTIDPEALEEELWTQGSMWLWVFAGIHLVASIVVGVLLHTLGGAARTGKAF